MVNSDDNCYETYFQLANDLDMQGETYFFTPIGSREENFPFYGSFDGANHTIINLQGKPDAFGGLFGYAWANISNLNIEYIFTQPRLTDFAGLCGYVYRDESMLDEFVSIAISNVNISYSGVCNLTETGEWVIGGLIGVALDFYGSTITDCKVSNFSVEADYASSVGGLSASVSSGTITNCVVENFSAKLKDLCDYGLSYSGFAGIQGTEIMNCRAENNATIVCSKGASTSYIGGFIDDDKDGLSRRVINCISSGNIVVVDTTSSVSYVSGFFGRSVRAHISNCLSLCNVEYTSTNSKATLTGLAYVNYSTNLSNNIVNGVVKGGSKFMSAGGLSVGGDETAGKYNANRFSVTGATSVNTTGATTDADMKLRSTYADWTDFDTYWVIDPQYNNGYPILKTFMADFPSTLFNGAGTESDPYLIETSDDLLKMGAHYLDDNASADLYFKLANDINMSKDSSGLPIHFTPICYNKSFDGYFDGNNKTISGLLIDNQYEYTGLFGTIASNHWVKNLTVKGNIYWDEAYAVGGVAGRVLAGGYLQNCHFEGNIIGVLNTKPSTECNGVVGKFEINGAIDCTATYTDLKYAKIGGTAESPTYTYYLYDWAQMTTYLYDKAVA